MKYTLIISALCLLAGCWQTADSYDIRKAIEKCGTLENVHQIAADFKGNETGDAKAWFFEIKRDAK